ncbi:MAG: NUDIX hydrolase [Lachnospiraceae bacterium]|nr:NUDIX hydrolase [Lachnospiraceae bacterium]
MDKIERVSRTLAYQGTILKIYKDHMRFPDGVEADWDFIHHDGAAAVVPVMDDGRILMVRQYRPALERFTLELPAGKLDAPGEDKCECAARELEEETGYKAGKMEWLINLNTTVAFCDEFIGIYLATELTKGHQHWDEGEEIGTELYTIDELTDMILTGKITDSKTAAALLAYRAKYVQK